MVMQTPNYTAQEVFYSRLELLTKKTEFSQLGEAGGGP